MWEDKKGKKCKKNMIQIMITKGSENLKKWRKKRGEITFYLTEYGDVKWHEEFYFMAGKGESQSLVKIKTHKNLLSLCK